MDDYPTSDSWSNQQIAGWTENLVRNLCDPMFYNGDTLGHCLYFINSVRILARAIPDENDYMRYVQHFAGNIASLEKSKRLIKGYRRRGSFYRLLHPIPVNTETLRWSIKEALMNIRRIVLHQV